MICRRCIVEGRVQGVWFRDTTRRKANELGVSGSAVNLANGAVEVIACGEVTAVVALCDWLWVGSQASAVSQVDCEPVPVQAVSGFSIG